MNYELLLLQKKADKLSKTIDYIHKVSEGTVAFQKKRAVFTIELRRQSPMKLKG
ncbi:hypothetical protein [Neobacillus soli]|uniref:hypothetical protein n=1 Tax=Neobacillus soli TaxID=220688 RepID=UPI000ABD7883|nr:hypothetical protein [Neobacillus soli]